MWYLILKAGISAGVIVTPVREPGSLRGAYRGPVTDGTPTVTDAHGRFAFLDVSSPVAFLLPDGEMHWEPLFGREDLDWPKPLRAYTWFTPPTDVAELRCLPAGEIAGVVHDADGRPLRGARVRLVLTGAEGRRLGRARTTWTDATGAFRARSLVVGSYAAEVEGVVAKGSWSTGTTDARVVALAATRTPPEREDYPWRPTCTGRVVDVGGRGVPDVLVTLSRHGVELTRLDEPLDVSDADGRFQLTWGPELDEVRAFPGDGWCASPPVARGDDKTPIVVTLARGVPLAGSVRTPEGLPARSASVWILAPGVASATQNVVTGEDGGFRAVVPAGAGPFVIQAYAQADREVHAPAGHVAGVAAGATDVVVRMRESTEFMPVVVRPDGTPGVGATVYLSSIDRSGPQPLDFAETVFRPHGEAWFTRVRPGRYRVVATGTEAEVGPSDPLEVDLPAPSPPTLALRPAVKVRWTIAGPPPAGQRASWAGPIGASASIARELAVAADGAVTGWLPAGRRGTLWIGAGRDDRYALVRDVGSEAPPATIAWAEGRSLTGRVDGLEAGESGFSVVAVGPDVRATAVLANDRTFAFRGLPPGSYRLLAWQTPIVQGDAGHGFLRMQFAEPPLEEWLLVDAGATDVVLPIGPHVVLGAK